MTRVFKIILVVIAVFCGFMTFISFKRPVKANSETGVAFYRWPAEAKPTPSPPVTSLTKESK